MIDSLISYFAVLRLQKVLKLPAFEEVGRESVGIWSVKDKMKCAECECLPSERVGTSETIQLTRLYRRLCVLTDYYSDCETLARSVCV